MNYAALRTEILTGPRAADCAQYVILPTDPKQPGAVAAQNDAAIAAILAEPKPGAVVYQPVSASDAMQWLATGPIVGITEAAGTVGHPCRPTALVAQTWMTSAQPWSLDQSNVRGMLDGWVAASVITGTERDALLALSARPASYAEASPVGANPTGADVSIALRCGNGFEVIDG